MKPVILIGGGGHAKVLAATLIELKTPILGFTDLDPEKTTLLGLPRLGTDEIILTHPPDTIQLAHGLGSIRPGPLRAKVFDHFKSHGYTFLTAIHPTATIAPDVQIGEGTVVFAGVIIQPGTTIGENCILNTRCSIDHDCRIGPHNHIAPGATLSGTITTGPHCHIGTGATLIQGLTLGESTLIGAGAVLLRNTPPHTTHLGNPARIIP
jgi:UDP-perosamine 4-acetyltransferase